MAYTKRAEQERFRKRTKNFLRRAEEIETQCGADIYVMVRRNGRYYTYRSKNCPSWPPPPEQVQTTAAAKLPASKDSPIRRARLIRLPKPPMPRGSTNVRLNGDRRSVRKATDRHKLNETI
jgi:hypothetical protein